MTEARDELREALKSYELLPPHLRKKADKAAILEALEALEAQVLDKYEGNIGQLAHDALSAQVRRLSNQVQKAQVNIDDEEDGKALNNILAVGTKMKTLLETLRWIEENYLGKKTTSQEKPEEQPVENTKLVKPSTIEDNADFG